MVTQTIKRWLSNLFAWWPWKRAAMTASVHLSRSGAMFKRQEPLCSASNDGSLPQVETTSVAVERGCDNIFLENCRPHSPLSSERVNIGPLSSPSKETVMSGYTTRDENNSSEEKECPLSLSPLCYEQTQDHANVSWDDATDDITSLTKQQKVFLRYLMRHGLMNEGFEEGHVPEQYRFKG